MKKQAKFQPFLGVPKGLEDHFQNYDPKYWEEDKKRKLKLDERHAVLVERNKSFEYNIFSLTWAEQNRLID